MELRGLHMSVEEAIKTTTCITIREETDERNLTMVPKYSAILYGRVIAVGDTPHKLYLSMDAAIAKIIEDSRKEMLNLLIGDST